MIHLQLTDKLYSDIIIGFRTNGRLLRTVQNNKDIDIDKDKYKAYIFEKNIVKYIDHILDRYLGKESRKYSKYLRYTLEDFEYQTVLSPVTFDDVLLLNDFELKITFQDRKTFHKFKLSYPQLSEYLKIRE